MSTPVTRAASFDAVVADLAGRQHGAFTRVQAIELGGNRGTIGRRLSSGRWVTRHPGVYLVAGVPTTWTTELSAALLARPGAAASHESAGVLHRMRYVPRGVISIIESRPSPTGLVGVEVHRPRRIILDRFTTIDGFPVTDAAATIVDLAAVLQPGRLERVLDDQLASHRLALPDIIGAFEQQARRGKKGIAPLRRLLDARAGGVAATRSALEQLFRTLVLPSITQEATFEFLPDWRVDGIGRADCAFVRRKVLVELDGRRWHLRDADFDADHQRDQEALEHDWRTVRYTYAQITNETSRVITNLRRILELGGS